MEDTHRRAAGQERSRSERQRAVEHERNGERERSAGRERAIQEQQRSEERRRNSEHRAREPGNQAAERSERGNVRGEEIRQARTRLSEQERQRLHGAFDLGRARISHATFDWHIGHGVPREVRLFPVPSEVISFFPFYRDYRYFVVGDEICIVDPRTYEVVDVIDQGFSPRPRPQVARLSLTAGQIAAVRDSIPADFPETGIPLRLALGAEIPEDVKLHEFAPIVLDRAPVLQDYRFLLTGDQIVIVDPRDRSIALVIDRA